MRNRYKKNTVGFGKLMQSPGVRDVVEKEAQRMARHLAQEAPRSNRRDPQDGKNYASSFEVSTGKDARRGDRAAAFVVNTRPYAVFLEVGSKTVKDPPMLMTRIAQSASSARRRRGGR